MVGVKEVELSSDNIVVILDVQVKIQQEFADFKNKGAKDIDVLRKENGTH